MGERNNIFITGLSALTAVDDEVLPPHYYIYGHWAGGKMGTVAVDALVAAQARYGDESYWLRIFLHNAFEGIAASNQSKGCGFGLGHPDDQDGYWNPVDIDYAAKTISCGDATLSFDAVYADPLSAKNLMRIAEACSPT